MDHYQAPDTTLNLYLYILRDELYKAIGICATQWLVKFEDEFYKRLNGSNSKKFVLGLIMFECTHNALSGEKVHLQDVLEKLA